MANSALDSAAAATKYRALACDYDRRAALRISAPARGRAVKRLELRPGDRVIDVACGTGLNFDAVREAIGPSGQLVGVDLSAEMLAWAHERVRERGWQNVHLLRSTIEDAQLDGAFDAALFSFTHDVLRSPRAVGNVVSALRAGGRVAAAGVMSTRGALAPLNPIVRRAARPYVTTFEGFDQPWSHLAELIPELRVERLLLGTIYVVSGERRSGAPRRDDDVLRADPEQPIERR